MLQDHVHQRVTSFMPGGKFLILIGHGEAATFTAPADFIPRFLELYAAGSYTSYWDVCTLDYLR